MFYTVGNHCLCTSDLVRGCTDLGFWTAGQRTYSTSQKPFVWKLLTSSGYRELPLNYTYWNAGEPNNLAEECLHVWQARHYRWNDVPCSAAMCHVCEYDI